MRFFLVMPDGFPHARQMIFRPIFGIHQQKLIMREPENMSMKCRVNNLDIFVAMAMMLCYNGL